MDGKLRNMASVYLVSDTGVLCLYRLAYGAWNPGMIPEILIPGR